MPDSTTFQGSPMGLVQRLQVIRKALAGDVPGARRSAQAAWKAVGIEALSIVKEAFVQKGRGGTDAAGITWKPLSPRYIAYHRRHPGLNAKRTRAGKAGRERRPLLTKAQDAQWRAIYAACLRKGRTPADAAAVAWAVLKQRGGKTILGEYGGAQVEIGRDTGRLLNSLSPGSREGKLEVNGPSVTVGTNVAYADHFHARRPMWPAEGTPWPEVWQERILGVLAEALKDVIADLLRRGL